MTQFSWQNSILFDLLIKVRFNHGKVLAYAPLIESQRGDILLIDFLEKPLQKDSLTELFGDLRRTSSNDLAAELKRFLAWFNEPPVGLDGALRSGVALFWFLAVSPFEENNEEIAREVCELALAQDEKMTTRLYDLPAQLNLQSVEYAKIFADANKNVGDISEFLVFFLNVLLNALTKVEKPTTKTMSALIYWKIKNDVELNRRQRTLLAELASLSITTISNKDYTKLFKVSRESAKRDLAQLKSFNLITSDGTKGRAVRYRLV